MEPLTVDHASNRQKGSAASLTAMALRERANSLRLEDDGSSNVVATTENVERVRDAITALETHRDEFPPETRFQFKVHEESGKIQIALVNYMTGEVVTQIPSSKLIEFSQQLEELSGLLVDEVS